VHEVTGCVLAPGESTEDTTTGDQVTTRMTVYAPPDADITATDRVTLPDGTRWQIIGDPQRFRTPFAALIHSPVDGVCMITIEKVTG
jgi:hypothetical protein